MKLSKKVDEYLNYKADLLAKGIATDFICGIIEKLKDQELNNMPILSPIEQLFWIEWQFKRLVSNCYCEYLDSKFELFPQVKNKYTGKYILDFKVDFFSGIMNSKDSKFSGHEIEISTNVEGPLLGIEIDSHVWHEKTKEQAKNDKERERFLVSQGWKLLRFTGSEVYGDTSRSVEETLLISHKLADRYKRLVNEFLETLKE